MKITPSYTKGHRYYWVHAASLACDFLGVPMTALHLYRKKPKNPGFQRVSLEVIRTKRECEQLDRKWQRRRAKFAKQLAAHVAAKAKEAKP